MIIVENASSFHFQEATNVETLDRAMNYSCESVKLESVLPKAKNGMKYVMTLTKNQLVVVVVVVIVGRDQWNGV